MISSTISVACFTGCLIGAILDLMAAYLLHRTDFTQCAYSSSNTTVSCPSPICPTLTLQPRTCYCCYLYTSRTGGNCNTPMYLAKQTYFSGVESCSDISDTLQPMISTMGALNLAAAIVSVVYVFQNRPIQYQRDRDSQKASNQRKDNGRSSNKMLYAIKMTVNYLICRTRNEDVREEAIRDTDIEVTNENS